MTYERFMEKLTMAVAWMLPRKLAYWSAIRVIAHATQGQFGNQIVPELLATDALKRWGQPHRADTPNVSGLSHTGVDRKDGASC